MSILVENLKKVRGSIVAIGFNPNPQQVTIIGSGFAVGSDRRILTAAHVYNQVPEEHRSRILGMAMTKQEENGLEHYAWLPLTFVDKRDEDDVAVFQIERHRDTLLQPLELGDSDKVAVGQEAYFVGFPYAAQLINDGFGITLIVNKGIISNIKRDGVDPSHHRNWFIVDAISNPGNSGCPLIDIETNKVIGINSISFANKSKVNPQLDIKEPMHITGAKPINLAKSLLG